MKLLSRFLFILSSFNVLPPPRNRQDEIITQAKKKFETADSFLKNSLMAYECHGHYFLKISWICFNIFAFVAFWPIFFILVLRSLKTVQKNPTEDIALFPKLPFEIRQKYAPKFITKPFGYLRWRDLKYIQKIILTAWFKPYFVFRSVWKIAIYSEIMDTYDCKRIWVTQEMVFECSLLTHYLNDFGIEHNNFMHGENYFSIQAVFCTFTQFYVWDEYYIYLFNSMQASVREYHVFSALERLQGMFPERNVLKYYAQGSKNKKTFGKVLSNLEHFTKQHGCGLMVRLHPLMKTDFEIELLNEKKIEIESNAVDIIDSIGQAKYVCSEFSSVLYQAWLLKRAIVIDNTYPERIELIKGLEPIFLKKLRHEYLVT
jgi:hypothetical protein